MKYYIFFLFLFIATSESIAQTLPKPKHLVIVMYENRDYTDIVGSSQAPYINSLLTDTATAYFTQAYGIVSGSQPNYLYLYSGADQGISGDVITSVQFTDCNLGASLIAAGYSFTGYSEDMPSVGYLGTSYANYARKHNPWSNWQGTGTNQIPATDNQPYSSFPSNYDSLPTVSFVVPNEIHNMHTPSDVTGIMPGDTWLHTNMDGYIQWAKKNNSLLLFTYDESSSSTVQHILVFFIGQNVKAGSYSENINFYSMLRTIEGMYSLPYCGASSTATPITDTWKNLPSGINEISASTNIMKLWPLPAKDILHIGIKNTMPDDVDILITDLTGKVVKETKVHIATGENDLAQDMQHLNTGMYFIRVSGQYINSCQKLVIEE